MSLGSVDILWVSNMGFSGLCHLDLEVGKKKPNQLAEFGMAFSCQ